jgi:hypothetical protein
MQDAFTAQPMYAGLVLVSSSLAMLWQWKGSELSASLTASYLNSAVHRRVSLDIGTPLVKF